MNFKSINSKSIRKRDFPSPTEDEIRAREEEALAFVRSKWPEATWEDVSRMAISDILRVQRQEQACSLCRESGVRQCDGLRSILSIFQEDWRGHTVYTIRAHPCPLRATLEAKKPPLDSLIGCSGLTGKQVYQTFQSYVTDGLGSDIKRAKGMAMRAAEDGRWLTLAGLRGTGKSHLAVAILHEVMKRGASALFRLVPEMLDDLRQGYEDNTHDAQMHALKTVSCLVLDDLGKERCTEAGYDFLYQIVDTRYRHRRQTIITTNAMSRKQLISWGRADILEPILSRIEELGSWCIIQEATDYRLRKGAAA